MEDKAPVDDQTLARVACKLPYRYWYQLGILHLKLNANQLDRYDDHIPTLFGAVYSTLHKYSMNYQEKEGI